MAEQQQQHQPEQKQKDVVLLQQNQTPKPDRKTELVRSRWTPKPEQIMVLESIFNSGTVNPPKEETLRIRKLLEKFGPVTDANVFYWFQNRRSRSRRKQRQIQAGLLTGQPQPQPAGGGGGSILFESPMAGSFGPNFVSYGAGSCVIGSGSSSSSSGGPGNANVGMADDFFDFSGQQLGPGTGSVFVTSTADASTTLYYQPTGLITVFINGVATEVGNGPLDMKAMFSEEFVLFHSSGVPVLVNEFGFSIQGLQHGESYFLVPRQS